MLIWIFDINWTTLCCVTLWCAFLAYLGFCPNCIFFWFLKVLCMHICYMCSSYGMLSFFDPIFRLNSIHLFIGSYSCGVCPMYCCFSNSLVPMSLGTILFVNVVLGTLEMHWRIVLFTRKVLLPCAFWSQARTINEALSTTSFPCYLGNKYLPHAYISCIQPCVGCIMA